MYSSFLCQTILTSIAY
uniref:Uncharacterized protein n=1 Tax=Moniliophthora roreri TaxID=221103 RepID=A0A0W0GAB2_MONRR